jgi:deoxyribonuclease-4
MAKLPPLGSHVSVAGGLATAFARAAELDCTAMQIFVKNANQWRGKPLEEDDVAAFREAWQASRVGPVVAHASYLINLAAAEGELRERSIAALGDELERCRRLELDGLVLHPGAHVGAGEEEGLERVAAGLAAVLAAAPVGPTKLLIENTAGQGTCLGHRLEHLAALGDRLEATAPGRLGYCLDTCHAFAAGYALGEEEGFATFVDEVEATLGWQRVHAFHLNDSVKPCGSRRDRHAHIGEGEIGTAAFARLLAEPRVRHIPMILETETGDEMSGHRQDLETLRRLAAPAPKASGRKASSRSGSGRRRSPSPSRRGS